MVAQDDDPCTELGIFHSPFLEDGLMIVDDLTYDSPNKVQLWNRSYFIQAHESPWGCSGDCQDQSAGCLHRDGVDYLGPRF